jgi:NAD(P)-dependent dehydrogenase (short-subunit alcohol dehydrogenase family)
VEQQQFYLITGATSGLGLATAQSLALSDPSVIIIVGARRPLEANALQQVVPANQLVLFSLDTSSLASVKKFVGDVVKFLGPAKLNALALNAGVQIVSGDYYSAEGFEKTFATNVLGHIALFDGLFSVLSANSVIVSTASGTHDKDHKLSKQYNFFGGYFPSVEQVAAGAVSEGTDPAQIGRDRYATSKLCNVLFTYAMARRHGPNGPRFMAYDPGLMPGTELVRDNTAAIRFAWKNLLPTAAKMIDGASTTKKSGEMLAQLLTGVHLPSGTGLHVEFTGTQIPSSVMSYDVTLQEALMIWAERTIAAA